MILSSRNDLLFPAFGFFSPRRNFLVLFGEKKLDNPAVGVIVDWCHHHLQPHSNEDGSTEDVAVRISISFLSNYSPSFSSFRPTMSYRQSFQSSMVSRYSFFVGVLRRGFFRYFPGGPPTVCCCWPLGQTLKWFPYFQYSFSIFWGGSIVFIVTETMNYNCAINYHQSSRLLRDILRYLVFISRSFINFAQGNESSKFIYIITIQLDLDLKAAIITMQLNMCKWNVVHSFGVTQFIYPDQCICMINNELNSKAANRKLSN